jgi:hypothetical protein
MMLPAANDVVLRTNDVAPRGAQMKGKNPPRRIFTFLLYFALGFVPAEKSRAPLHTLPTLPQAGGLLHRRCRCFLSARILCSYIDFLDIL